MSYWMSRTKFGALASCVAVTLCAAVRADQQPKNPWNANGSPGLSALAAAADEGRFTYVLFWRDNDDATQRMNAVLQQATAQMKSPVSVVSVRVTEPREAETVKVFGVDRAPLPLIAAVAPNGAVTKAWPLKATPRAIGGGSCQRWHGGMPEGHAGARNFRLFAYTIARRHIAMPSGRLPQASRPTNGLGRQPR